MGLPQEVVERDRSLEQANESGLSALMEHRWHWTLDESNPGRLTIREYGRQVDRAWQVIARYTNGYVIWRDTPGGVTPTEARDRASMSAETEAATQAVAEAFDMSFSHVRRAKPETVRRVRESARQRAEEKGTSVAEELPKQARIAYKSREAGKREKQRRQELVESMPADYLAVFEAVNQAYKHLVRAIRRAENVQFTIEQRELLEDTIANFKRLLPLLDRAVADSFDKSWQREIRLIEGGKAS